MQKRFICFAFFFSFLFLSGRAAAEDLYRYYALACPFETVTDEISRADFLTAFRTAENPEHEIQRIYLSSEAAADFPDLFRDVPPEAFRDNPAKEIEKTDDGVVCGVLPLDQADPTMKLIRVDHSFFPWDDVYDPKTDILAVPSAKTNFFPDRVTTVLLTGTTAFARTVAYKMAENGTTYPAQMIKSVFDSSDITHVSNESSLWAKCPEPRRDNVSIQFCSPTAALEVFDYLGVDVIELTGNHLRDFDWKPFSEMLDLFDQKGYLYYGAGRDMVKAAAPLFLEHNGNRFVFLGCNCAGPEHVYADECLPGVARCDFDRLENQIRSFSGEGYLVIVTLQYFEINSRTPSDIQKRDFKRLSEAGAVIVSGSQAHLAQVMEPLPDRFIHYGPGNLFFDQMDVPVKGTRQEFLDRYVFYDGRLLTVQLVTALLTDYSRPCLMTPEERAAFLTEIFSLQ